MAPRRNTTTTTRPARQQAKPKAQPVERPQFTFGAVTDYVSLLEELERYNDYAMERKRLASTLDKAQYWSGQMYANKALIAALRAQIDFDQESETDDEVKVAS